MVTRSFVLRTFTTKKIALLLGVSPLAVAAFGIPSHALESTTAEEVVITGSLIRGAAAVGVPVMQFDMEDVARTASLTVSDALKRVPAINVPPTYGHAADGGNVTHAQRANIHRQGGNRTLVLIDGKRTPLTGVYYSGYDPSIVPAISVARTEVLADGASATYGSDAVAGVINVILQRGFDGANTQAMYQYVEDGGSAWQVAQLYGTTWDGGDVTVGFDYFSQQSLEAKHRPELETWDWSSYNGPNHTPLRSSLPATVTFNGNAALPAGQVGSSGAGCTNCFRVPKGQNGVGLTYATLLANPHIPQTTPTNPGTHNLVNPRLHAQTVGPTQKASATITFDQRLWDGVELFVDAFYSNRRSPLTIGPIHFPWDGASFTNFVVPSNNPYYPVGTPLGTVVRVNYSLVAEFKSTMNVKEHSSRWSAGFNIDLPYDWKATAFYAMNEEYNRMDVTTANPNNIRAALGNVIFDADGAVAPYTISTNPNRTVAATDLIGLPPNISALYPPGTKVRVISPTNVPFLNVFCDPEAFLCNDPRTLDFITAHWIDISNYQVEQWSVRADGPLFSWAGGEVRAAIGVEYLKDDLTARADRNISLITAELTKPVDDPQERSVWSAFGELHIPIFGESNAIPLVQRLELAVSGRYDHYSDFGDTFNPKFSADWEIIEGLMLRGVWGTSYAAPAFRDIGILGVKQVTPLNIGGQGSLPLCESQQIQQGLAPTQGSAAAGILGAIGAANCSDAAIDAALAALPASNPYRAMYNPFGATAASRIALVRFPTMLFQNGGAGPAFGTVRPPGQLEPEEATNWSVGFDFTPNFLPGFNVFASYFNVNIENYLGGRGFANNDLNDPTARDALTVLGDDAVNTADGSGTFAVALSSYLSSPALGPGLAAQAPLIAVLRDQMTTNLHRFKLDGIDFGASYNWDMGSWGAWRIGTTGTYYLNEYNQPTPNPASRNNIYQAPTNPWGVSGNTVASRLITRSEIGWRDIDNGLDATLFVNHRSHRFGGIFGAAVPPPAVLDFVNGTTGTPNSLTLPQNAAALTRAQQTWNYLPEWFSFDFSVGYDLADRPSNPYLKNLAFRLTVNDILDRKPPMYYFILNNGGGPQPYDPFVFSSYGRTIALQVTKNW